jgi:predicted nucleotidyltransferase
MDPLIDIGHQLVASRRVQGITQAQLAGRLGVKRQQVQRWESVAYRTASLERVSCVAEALGWNPPPNAAVPLLAAEAPAIYGAPVATPDAPVGVLPVRDLGEIVARIRQHAPELAERYGVTDIAVFGSFARGEQTPGSDVDLIVEVERPTLETVFGSERRLGEILGRRTEAGSLDAVNPRVRRNIEEDLVHVWTT